MRPAVFRRFSRLFCLLLCLTCTHSILADPLLNADIPVVLTPTRLSQPINEVPAPVTVITAEQIEALGITSLPEALRLVPGMAIAHTDGDNYSISYHGTQVLTPRRMQVLIDGISIYRPGTARVDWHRIPVSVDELDRIEVTRSPNSVAYGANAFLAVVNIITKDPWQDRGQHLRNRVDSMGDYETLYRLGVAHNRSSWRLTLSHRHEDGFDANEQYSGHRAKTLNWRLSGEAGANDHYDLVFAYARFHSKVPNMQISNEGNANTDTEDMYWKGEYRWQLDPQNELRMKLTATQVDTQQESVGCYPALAFTRPLFEWFERDPDQVQVFIANRDDLLGNELPLDLLARIQQFEPGNISQAAAEAMSTTCGDFDQNALEKEQDLELQYTQVVSPQLRWVTTAGIQNASIESETYFGGKTSNLRSRLMTNIEYRPTHNAIFNIGGIVEEDEITGSHFSPRLALNYHFNAQTTGRISYTEAVRIPDLAEQKLNWTYTFRNLETSADLEPDENVFFIHAISPGGLTQETIDSYELGLNWRSGNGVWSQDISLFYDELEQLVPEALLISLYQVNNSGWARMHGVETQGSLQLNRRWQLGFSYGYLDTTTNDPTGKEFHARHTGAAYVRYQADHQWQYSLAYYGADDIVGFHYGRYDATAHKRWNWNPGVSLKLSLIARHYSNDEMTFRVGGTNDITNGLNSPTTYLLRTELEF